MGPNSYTELFFLDEAVALRRDVLGVPNRTDAWRVVTATQPTPEQWGDLEFAWRVCAAVSSNAIVYVKDRQAVGIGAGQQNRLDSARIAETTCDAEGRFALKVTNPGTAAFRLSASTML